MNFKSTLRFLFFSLLVIQFVSCGSDTTIDDDMGPGTIDLAKERQDIAENIANNFIEPAYDNLLVEMIALQTLVNDLSPFDASITDAELDALRSNLKTTWLLWQDAAIYQIGPATNNALHGAMNSYPVSTALIEENIVNGNTVFGTLANQSAEGLPAIDYLINKENALTELADPKRMTYLLETINHLETVTKLVNNSWDTYLTTFKSESSNGTDVGSALGILVNAIDLNFQRTLRDGKIAIPAGVRSAGVPRPLATEAYYGGYSIELLDRALNAYLNFFKGTGINGNNGTSILSYLDSIDQAKLADDIEAKFLESIQKANTLSNPLSAQIEADPDKVVDVFLVLQELVTLFKSDMASFMGITITNIDTDGD